jgi:hypothetical protein
MIKFNKPTNLNGAELLNELKTAKINVVGYPVDDAAGGLWLDIDEKDTAAAKAIVDAHNGTVVAPDLSAARQALLDKLGITADEAKLLLG